MKEARRSRGPQLNTTWRIPGVALRQPGEMLHRLFKSVVTQGSSSSSSSLLPYTRNELGPWPRRWQEPFALASPGSSSLPTRSCSRRSTTFNTTGSRCGHVHPPGLGSNSRGTGPGLAVEEPEGPGGTKLGGTEGAGRARGGRLRRGSALRSRCRPRLLPRSKMEALSRAGQEMSLAALKQHDPYIISIADVTGQVALYSFSPKANEWEKTDIEGTLFVYRRSASPYHGFTIVNRLNMHNLVEPVNKDLEFQLHEPFLLYRNASLSIYSIWFYDKNDCHRIAKLMAKVVEQEAQRSHQVVHDRRSPSRTNGCSENRPIDILEMLSKAKDEYERNQINDLTIMSNSGIQQNANPTKLENLEASEQMSSALQVQDQLFQSRHKHLTVEELFGTSLPKEQPTIPCSNPDKMEKLPADTSGKEHSLLLPFSFEQSSVMHQPLGKGESSGVKTSASTLTSQDCVAPVLIAPTSVSQPDIKNVANYTVRLSPILNSVSTTEAATPKILHNLKSNNIMQVMQQASKQISPLMNQPPSDANHAPQNLMACQTQFITPLATTSTGNTSSNTPLPTVDLFQKLRLTPQHDQIPTQSLSKITITPNISCTVSQLATPESFKESHAKPATLNSKIISPLQIVQQNKEPEVFPQPKTMSKTSQVAPPQFATATTTVAPSILLSPSVFQQSATKSTEVENKATPSSPLTLGATEIQAMPPTVLSRSQLQETLIHLIKNDSSFLTTIHDVYLQVLTKNTDINL